MWSLNHWTISQQSRDTSLKYRMGCFLMLDDAGYIASKPATSATWGSGPFAERFNARTRPRGLINL